MACKPRYTAKEVADALTETKGMLFLAAQRLGCDPETIRNYCKRYPSVQAAKDAQRGRMIDTAELKLWQSIQNGEAWGITLCLRTLGRNRGYVEQQDVDVSGTLKVVRLPQKAVDTVAWTQEHSVNGDRRPALGAPTETD